MKKKIVILGSTGSIGKTTFDIIIKNQKDFEIILLTTNKNINKILQQAKKLKVKKSEKMSKSQKNVKKSQKNSQKVRKMSKSQKKKSHKRLQSLPNRFGNFRVVYLVKNPECRSTLILIFF